MHIAAKKDLCESVPFGFDELALHSSGERHPHRTPLLVGKIFLAVHHIWHVFFSPLGVTLVATFGGIVRLGYKGRITKRIRGRCIMRSVNDGIKKSRIYVNGNKVYYCVWFSTCK